MSSHIRTDMEGIGRVIRVIRVIDSSGYLKGVLTFEFLIEQFFPFPNDPFGALAPDV